MRIEHLSEPVCEVPFLNAGRGGRPAFLDRLPVHVGTLDRPPEGLDAVLATADLQGRWPDDPPGDRRLLGEALPRLLREELLPDLGVDPARCGVLLCGDFYTLPDLSKRGGSGDVRAVWRAFAGEFPWVVGVAGNHDTFGQTVAPAGRLGRNATYLDGSATWVDGLSVAGVGGIVGNPRKPHRKTEEEFDRLFGELLDADPPDVLLLHDGPDDPRGGGVGKPRLRASLEARPRTLVVRGHAHWEEPLAELDNGTQVLNVDCRVAVLRAG